MTSPRCSSPPPENIIRLEDLIKKCPGAPKRNKKKRRARGEGSDDGADVGSGATMIGFGPERSDGCVGGRGEDERTPPEYVRPQRLFHDEDNDACTCTELSRILDLSATTSCTRAAPQDAAQFTGER